jgi:hypothetical protein
VGDALLYARTVGLSSIAIRRVDTEADLKYDWWQQSWNSTNAGGEFKSTFKYVMHVTSQHKFVDCVRQLQCHGPDAHGSVPE